MKKYKVTFSGFVYVMANSPEEAMADYESDDALYEEQWGEDIIEVDDFPVDI